MMPNQQLGLLRVLEGDDVGDDVGADVAAVLVICSIPINIKHNIFILYNRCRINLVLSFGNTTIETNPAMAVDC